MKSGKVESLAGVWERPLDPGARPKGSPEVTELLDHLAQELALEYVRLMEQAAEVEDATPDEPGREEE